MRTKLMVEESISGQMAENIMENGKIITCMERVSTHGKMAVCMKVTMKMIGSTAMEFTPGMMESNTKAGGKMENSTVKVSIEKMDVIEKVSGKMARESNGLETRQEPQPDNENNMNQISRRINI